MIFDGRAVKHTDGRKMTDVIEEATQQLAETEKVVNIEQYSHLKVAVVDGYDWTAAFEAAVPAVSSNGKFVIPQGEYILTRKITLNSSDIEIDFNNSNFIWRGVGADSQYQGIFQFNGDLTGISTTVSVDEPEKTNTITVVDASIFSVGDYILIKTPDGAADKKDVYNRYFCQIVKKSGNVLYTNYRKRLGAKTSLGVVVTKVNALKNIKVKNFHAIAEGQTSRSNGIGGIVLTYCDNVSFENVSFKNLWFKGIKTTYCTNVLIDGVSVAEPAAVSGGEGYGVQFEYSHLIKVKKGRFQNVRHGTDCTASTHIDFEDCITVSGTATSYVLHKAFEWNINYMDCHSISDAQGGWACGSVDSGFGDTTDDIILEKCRAIDSVDYGFSAVGIGKNYTLKDSSFSIKAGSSGAAVKVTQNNTKLINCKLNGALDVLTVTGATNDGYVAVNSGSELNYQTSNRSFILRDNTKIAFADTFINGRADIGENCEIKGMRVTMKSEAELQFFGYLTTKANIVYNFIDSEFHALGAGANTTYVWEGKELKMKGCKFINPNTKPFSFKTTRLVIDKCEGVLRGLIDAVTGFNAKMVLNIFDAAQGSRIMNITNSSGVIAITDNDIKMSAASNVSVGIDTTNTGISGMIKDNHFNQGGVILNGVTKGFVTDNIINGTTVTLPTGNGTSLYVDRNVVNA